MHHMKKVKLELISDPGIFFERVVRVKVSCICNRYSKANNKYLKSYDPKQKSKHIVYLYANNLYGYVISEFLPTSAFKWLDPMVFDLNKYSYNSSKCFVLKLDLEFLKELPELCNDYPSAPKKIEIKREMLSEHQLRIAIIIASLLVMLKNECLTLLIKKNICLNMKF